MNFGIQYILSKIKRPGIKSISGKMQNVCTNFGWIFDLEPHTSPQYSKICLSVKLKANFSSFSLQQGGSNLRKKIIKTNIALHLNEDEKQTDRFKAIASMQTYGIKHTVQVFDAIYLITHY